MTASLDAVLAAVPAAAGSPLLDVRSLSVRFRTPSGLVSAVDDVSFSVAEGEIVGIAGESGSGKTVTALSIMRLLPRTRTRVSGRVDFRGRDLLTMSLGDLRKVRGRRIAMVFQEPMTSLHPAWRAGEQIAEVIRAHEGLPRDEAWARTIDMLDLVGIPDPGRRARQYPHELSGGMQQRVMIAMALACGPALLIADEPTTALDVTIQAQIVELIRELHHRLGMAVIFVSHDLALLANLCDRVVVMYGGQVVEDASVGDVFSLPKHPYTEALMLSSVEPEQKGMLLPTIPGSPEASHTLSGCRFAPRCVYVEDACRAEVIPFSDLGSRAVRCRRQDKLTLRAKVPRGIASVSSDQPSTAPVLVVQGLRKEFELVEGVIFRRGRERAVVVDGVDFEIGRGQAFGLVGESGSGKSTTARMVLRLLEPTAGRVLLDGDDITALRGEALRRARRSVQAVFQDIDGSLDSRMTAGEIITEPLRLYGDLSRRQRRERTVELLETVGLRPQHLDRFPHELSGGQRQRVALARALSVHPKLLVLDEPVSALDVSTRAQVMNLLEDLRSRLHVAYLLIAHDLSVVHHLCESMGVMYLGRIVESGRSTQVYARPRHPYTRALLSATPSAPQRDRIVLRGDVPPLTDLPTGCRFHTRCPYAFEPCATIPPPELRLADGGTVACHLHTEGPRLQGETVIRLGTAVPA
jgi:peptide/nickel transport system ATP-binding protein